MRRRQFLGSAVAAALRGQSRPPVRAPEAPPRSRPIICLYSQRLVKIEYAELGGILKQLGAEGCDLAVRKGGHVLPALAPVDMVRSIECIRDAGVDVPMITTDFLSAADPHTANVLGLAGEQYLGIPYFRPGYYHYGLGLIDTWLAQVHGQLSTLVMMGRAYGIAAGFHNHSGDYVGAAVWDIRELIRNMDPRWIGYCFDPCHATSESDSGEVSLRLALPRLKMLAVQDFYWEKAGGRWSRRMCPMGQGMVEWPKIFAALAAAGFTGPLTVHVEYAAADELAAIAADLAWVRKYVDAAWPQSAALPNSE